MKGQLLKTAAVFILVLTLAASGRQQAGAQDKDRTLDSIITYENSLIKAGVGMTGELLKTTKTEKSATEDAWNEIYKVYFASFATVGYFEFDSLLKKERNESVAARAAEWAEAVKLFTSELQSAGEVVTWQRGINREIDSLEFDTKHVGERVSAYLRAPSRDGPRAEGIMGELKSGKLTTSALQERLDDVRSMKSAAENISAAVIRAVDETGRSYSLKKEMPRPIAKILESWTDMADRHPGVDPEIAGAPAEWVPIAKKRWENYSKAREEFNKAFGPLLEEKIFKDIPIYRDYGYEDLAKPFRKLELDLKVALAASAQKDKSEAELRQAIARDEELTLKEQQQVWTLWGSVSPDKKRSLQYEYSVAGGGSVRIREIQLALVKLPEESGEYKKLREEAVLLSEFRRPDQLAVVKKIREFEDLERKVEEEVRKIVAVHEKRRRSLGMEPGIFSR